MEKQGYNPDQSGQATRAVNKEVEKVIIYNFK